MSTRGWYPDPAGTPGAFRWWDGQRWSNETTTNPAAQPNGPLGGGLEPEERRGGPGAAILIGLLVVLLIAGGVWWWRSSGGGSMAAEDHNTSTPTISAWDETSSPTPQPSGSEQPEPSGGAMVSCPTSGGGLHPNGGDRITGGGLSFPRVPGWDDPTPTFFSMPWTHDMGAQTSTVYDGWFSLVSVGALAVADGFEEPRRSTQMMMSCFATSSYYRGFSGRRDLVNQAVTISGHKGWHLRSEIYVEMLGLPQVKGDVVDVIVVDVGSPESLGVWVSSFTIDDTGRQAQVEAAMSGLTVG